MSSDAKRTAQDEARNERAAKRRRMLDEAVPDMPEAARQTLAELPDEVWAIVAEQLTPATDFPDDRSVALLNSGIYHALQRHALAQYRRIYAARAAVLKRLDLGRRDAAWAREFQVAGGGTEALDRLMDSALGVVLRNTLLAETRRGHGLRIGDLLDMAGTSIVGEVVHGLRRRHDDMARRGDTFPFWCIYYEVVLKLAGQDLPRDMFGVMAIERFLRHFYEAWATYNIDEMLIWMKPRHLRGLMLSGPMARHEIIKQLMVVRYAPAIIREALDEMLFTDRPLREIYDFCFSPDMPHVPTGTSLESFLERLSQIPSGRTEETLFWLEAERAPRPFYRTPYDPVKTYWVFEFKAFVSYDEEPDKRRLRVLFDPSSVPTDAARRANIDSLRHDVDLLEDVFYVTTDAADEPIPPELHENLEDELTGAWTVYPDDDKYLRVERTVNIDE